MVALFDAFVDVGEVCAEARYGFQDGGSTQCRIVLVRVSGFG